ncbi:MAG: LysE family transporter [Achromobacter sp.]|nr:LysE family transporter [Achromobacter sp.]
MNLLLLSNSSSDAGYLVHALPDIRELIASLPAGAPAVFVPYAGVTRDWDDYTTLVVSALADTGLDIQGLHRAADPAAALEQAAVIIVGGGNTFNLLGQLRRQGLLSVVARRVREGAAYLGWLGFRMLTARPGDKPVLHIEPRHYFRQAGLITLMNPKSIVFYMAFFPLFVDPASHQGLFTFGAMAATVAALTFLYGLTAVLLTHFLAERMRANPRIGRALEKLAGVFLIGFGIKLAISR